jgi:hypothetical protein
MRTDFTDISIVKQRVKELNIAETNSLTFMAAVVILWACENQTWNIRRIAEISDYSKRDVRFFIDNLNKHNYIKYWNFYLPEEENNIFGFTIAAMIAAGEFTIFNAR